MAAVSAEYPSAAAGRLADCFVEIDGAPTEVEAYDFLHRPLDEQVDPNGRRGMARWVNDEFEEYIVETIDGLLLCLPEEHLNECQPPIREAGGFDLSWPVVSAEGIGTTFALRVCEKLQAHGYCAVQMPTDDQTVTLAKGRSAMRTDWTLPREEFQELFLGKDSSCNVAWLAGADAPDDLTNEPLSVWYRRIEGLLGDIMPMTAHFLGFKASDRLCCPLLRRSAPPAKSAEDPVFVRPEDAESGLVEMHLDFVQRRKLCVTCVISSGGGFELSPRIGGDPIHFPARAGLLLLFRHDLFGYRYTASIEGSLALQTWLLEESQQLSIEGLVGDQQGLERVLAGPKIAPGKQVHACHAHCRFPGNAYHLAKDFCAYKALTDTFVEIPIGRFDVTQYYDDGLSDQFNANGKSSTKHCGLLGDQELIAFDNQFFGYEEQIAEKIPPILRVCMELSYEILSMAGFTRDTLRGSKMMLSVADIGLEWDVFYGFHEPQNWLKALPVVHLTVNRLAHNFGIIGPTFQVDTACSASLVASNMCHAYLRKGKEKGVEQSLSMGQQSIMFPWPMIGLSSAGMLGRGGRCKTFDQSANGYNRGEGCGALFCKVGDELEVIQDRLACWVSSYINQDGRSASLTAPNGPSQQMVVRGSLTQGEITPDLVTCTENHGTGTALGDPIETGTIKSVFRRRDRVLPVTSGKSHMGHLECGAGMVGILKSICSIVHAAVPGNCHLRMPNAHCEVEGFPGMFPVELCDIETEYHYAGCNGFGFGGTNTRADFWGFRRNEVHRYENPRRELMRPDLMGEDHQTKSLFPRLEKLEYVTVQCPRCLGPMCWLCGVVPAEGRLPGKHRCTDVREEGASYEYCSQCYTGGFLCRESNESIFGGDWKPDQKVCLSGSWNAWKAPAKMEPVGGGPDHDTYEGEFTMGDTLQEQFHLIIQTGRSRQTIHPVVKQAGQRVQATGPVEKNPGNHWLVNGWRDGAAEGSTYRVRFEFGECVRSVAWWCVNLPALQQLPCRRYQHQYYIVNSLSSWSPIIGTHDAEDPFLWRWFNSQLPSSGRVELFFLRDSDQAQMIYPMSSNSSEESVPVVGPDDGGAGKRWLAVGRPGEQLVCSLRVEDGKMRVTVQTKSMGVKTWHGITQYAHFLVGSWNDWNPTEMLQGTVLSSTYKASFTIGQQGREEFQILRNQNWNQRLYPATGSTVPGSTLVCGPDRKGNHKNWEVSGPPGLVMEVTLDLDAEDHHRMVSCVPVGESLQL